MGQGAPLGREEWSSKSVPPRTLWVGVPAKLLRDVSDSEAEDLIEHAQRYEKLALVHANRGTDLGFV